MHSHWLSKLVFLSDDSFNYGYKLALSSQQAVLDNILLREQTELKAQLSEAIQDEVSFYLQNNTLKVSRWKINSSLCPQQN